MSSIRSPFTSFRTLILALSLLGLTLYTFTISIVSALAEVVCSASYHAYFR